MRRLTIGLAAVGVVAVGALIGHFARRPSRVIPPPRSDDQIVICGRHFHTGSPVVRWDEPGGFDGYLEHCWADPTYMLPKSPVEGCNTPRRYNTRACLVDDRGERLALDPQSEFDVLRERIDRVVLHYDAAGSSRRCFEVLQDERGLSAHFLLDLDGTIYQTLDVRERARHAGPTNDRSVGIEIANVGAYESLDELTAAWRRMNPPAAANDTPEPISGVVQGRTLQQFPFTEAQYQALACLVRTLREAFARIEPRTPMSEDGLLFDRMLPIPQQDDFAGIVGHFHVSELKVDPGPAFDWTRLLRDIQSSEEGSSPLGWRD